MEYPVQKNNFYFVNSNYQQFTTCSKYYINITEDNKNCVDYCSLLNLNLKEKECIDYCFQYNLYYENDICSEECDLYKKSEIRGKKKKNV